MIGALTRPSLDQVNVLLAHTDCINAAQWQTFRSWLNDEEAAKLQRLQRPIDQQMFLLGRALLRATLGHWLQLPPARVLLLLDQNGKPYCPDQSTPAFNLAHSGGLVVAAWAHAAVGVDIEKIDPTIDWALIAQDHFSIAERSVLNALPGPAQIDGFYRYWTLKEAYGKATGTGILTALDALNFEATSAPRYRRSGIAAPPAQHEFIWAAKLSTEFSLAVTAFGGRIERLALYQLEPDARLLPFEFEA